jgi:hypothetical protein
MDLFFSILTFIGVGLIILTALTIGLSLLVWALVAGAVFSLYVALRRHFAYRSFVRESESQNNIIEGEYQDLTDQRKP